MLDVDMAGAIAGGAKLAVYFSTFDEKGLVDILSAVINDQPTIHRWCRSAGAGTKTSRSTMASPGRRRRSTTSTTAFSPPRSSASPCASRPATTAPKRRSRTAMPTSTSRRRAPMCWRSAAPPCTRARAPAGRWRSTRWCGTTGPGSGTGGGVSDLTPAPGWQEGKTPRSLNPGNFAGRAIPDVAANADPATGYLVMNGGKFGIVGGTSAAAPLWACLITRINALSGARTGNFNALLYGSIGPAGCAARHHQRQQRHRRAARRPVCGGAGLGRLHRMGRAGRGEVPGGAEVSRELRSPRRSVQVFRGRVRPLDTRRVEPTSRGELAQADCSAMVNSPFGATRGDQTKSAALNRKGA